MVRLCSPRYPVDKTDVLKRRSGKAPGRPEAGVRRGRAGLGGGRSNGTVGARLPTPMSDDEEQSAAESDFAPPLSPRLYLTMGLAASMLRAYHRIARMVRKAWTDIRFGECRPGIRSLSLPLSLVLFKDSSKIIFASNIFCVIKVTCETAITQNSMQQ